MSLSPSYCRVLKWALFLLILLNILVVLGKNAIIRHRFGIEKAISNKPLQSGDAPHKVKTAIAENAPAANDDLQALREGGTATGQGVWDPSIQEEIVEAVDVLDPEDDPKNLLEGDSAAGQDIWDPSSQEEIVEAVDVLDPEDNPCEYQ